MDNDAAGQDAVRRTCAQVISALPPCPSLDIRVGSFTQADGGRMPGRSFVASNLLLSMKDSADLSQLNPNSTPDLSYLHPNPVKDSADLCEAAARDEAAADVGEVFEAICSRSLHSRTIHNGNL